MPNIKNILAQAVQFQASDVHINVTMPPMLRINTELIAMELPIVSNDDAKQMLLSMIGEDRFKKFEDRKEADFSTVIDQGSRFRVNAHYQRETIAMSFRVITDEIPPIDNLHLPEVIKDLTNIARGLIIITGPTGSGKSTTLAAMIESINTRHKKHVITLEDPIEYMLQNENSMIEQREIGCDCLNFADGLRHALRQDPDIIMVGEMRDLETTSATITAAETGHLVFSTLHTINAYQTVERIVDIYPPGQQNQIRMMLANTLRAVISQTLFRRIDEPGMVPCTEILLCTTAVRSCIRENRIFEIPNIIETSRKLGMQTMDKSIADMYSLGYIDKQDAIMHSSNPARMEKALNAAEPALANS